MVKLSFKYFFIKLFKIIFLAIIYLLFYIKPVQASSWSYVGTDNNTIGVIAVSPANNSIMYCNGTLNSSVYDLFKSIDSGETWSPLALSTSGLPINPEIRSIALHPSDPNTIYVGVFNKGIYKSTDAGNHWISMNFLTPAHWQGNEGYRIKALSIDQTNPQILYAGLGNNNCINGGVYKSTDGGITWQEKPVPAKCDILLISFDPTDSRIIYATGSRSYKSTDKGETWVEIPIIRVGENAFAIDPQNHDILYASQSTSPFGFFKSINAGSSWQRIGLIDKRIHEIVVDRENPNIIYASTRAPDFPGTGVWKSEDKGVTLSQMNEGLPTLETAALAISYQHPKKLFVGTIGHGLWSYDLEPVTPIVLLPGFTGSWNLEAFITSTTSGPWKKIPILWPYDNLRLTLTESSLNYVENQDYFEFYYDWRKKISNLADDFNNYLNNIVLLNKPEKTKVYLIGHSMGGLVARAYANKYGVDKIEKIITVGSPHTGVLKSYYAWEGGRADEENSYNRIIFELYLETQRKKFHTLKDSIQEMVPSIRDMMPIFSYLKKADGSIIDVNNMTEQNEYLTSLVDPDSLKQKMVTIYGKEDKPEKDTTEYYKVTTRNSLDALLGLWVDGYPVGKESTEEGDLTVLSKSAIIPNASSSPKVIGSHTEIIESSAGIQEILKALDINGVTPNTSHTSSINLPALLVLVRSPANIKVIAPNGEAGHNVSNPLTGSVYSPDDKLIFIPEAQKGNYQVQLTGTGNGLYELDIGQLTEKENKWQEIKGKINTNESVNLNLEFNPDLLKENPLTDNNGDLFLKLAKQQLEALNEYTQTKVTPNATKKALSYQVNKIIKIVNQATVYFNKGNYNYASKYVFSSLDYCYHLEQEINQYFKQNRIGPDKAIYLKNELNQISELLGSSWVILYKKSGNSITKSKVLNYKNALIRIFSGLEPKINDKAKNGKNQDLGLAYFLALEKQENAQPALDQSKLEEAYINFVLSRFYLLETTSLLR